MAQPKPSRSPAEVEDIILRRIFQVTLGSGGEQRPPVVYLEQTAAEILSEGRPLLMSRDIMERILIDRLSAVHAGTESSFEYLVQCYRRAQEEGRKVPSMKDNRLAAEMEIVVKESKQLALSYSRIVFGNPDMFAQPSPQKTSPLLGLLLEGSTGIDIFGGSNAPGITAPPGFLDDFFREFDKDSLEPKIGQVYEDLRASVRTVSPLGNFQGPLRALIKLINYPLCAEILVNHPSWIPKGQNVDGRVIEGASILGPFFHISALPDHPIFISEPNVGQQFFAESDSRRPGDLKSAFAAVKTVMHQIYDGLRDVLLPLLKSNNTRENVLEYLAEVINKNAARAHMQVNPFKCASCGTFVNLSAVMLKLCEPFLDANFTKRDKILSSYVLQNSRLDLRGLTAIHASSEEIAAWVDKNNYARTEGFKQIQQQKEKEERRVLQSKEATSSGSNHTANSGVTHLTSGLSNHLGQTKYSFVCECFFMTARVLNLGLLKAVSDIKSIVQDLSRHRETKAALEAMRGPGAPPQLEQDINHVNAEIERSTQAKLCYEAQIIRDIELLQQGLTFYRLMLVWLVSLVGGFKMPLPADCPMQFAFMPEHFVDDAMELLLFSSRIPKALDGVILDEFMNFIIMFMASPLYVKNPYLRAKMVEVLNAWMPHKSGSSAMATLFEGHSLALEYLVFNLLKLYVDIEFTGAHTQFYDKFNIRHNIAELLEYLWQVPSHRNAWIRIARRQETGVYLNFLNFLINDSIFLLDESLNKIPELKEMEAQMGNPVEWEQRPAHERQERMRHFHSQQQLVRIDMMLANEDVGMLAYSSDEITAPFLLPQMVERVANMLNYFLAHLVGPKRKTLTLKDPEKYEFRPRELLKQIVQIYVHLARGDRENVFPSAISSDGRSYNDELFSAAAEVLRKIGEDGRTIQEFIELGAKAKAAASDAMDTDAILGDIPEEFLDPIQFTLMRDPVILPASKTTVDRPTIQRHLLSDSTDPFNRSFLTPDMLISDTELKAKIEEFIRTRTKS